MEFKLNVYANKYCKNGEIVKEATANDFELSLGVCEDVLDIIQIDLFEADIKGMKTQDQFDIILGIVKNGFPFFKDLMKEIFDLTDDEIRCVKIKDVAKVVADIVKYSFKTLKPLAKEKN